MTRNYKEGLAERYDPEIDPFHSINEDEADAVLSSDELQRILVKMIGDLCLLEQKEFLAVSTAYRILRQWDSTPSVADNSTTHNANNLTYSRPEEGLPLNAAYLAVKDELKEKGIGSSDYFRKLIQSAVEKAPWIKAIIPD